MLKNKKPSKVKSEDSFSAAQEILTDLINNNMKRSKRVNNKPMTFYFSIAEQKNSKKVTKKYVSHFKATITKKGSKDQVTIDRYDIPETSGGGDNMLKVKNKIPPFVKKSSTGGGDSKKTCIPLDIPALYSPYAYMYWPMWYNDPLYTSYVYSGYYPFDYWFYDFGYPWCYYTASKKK